MRGQSLSLFLGLGFNFEWGTPVTRITEHWKGTFNARLDDKEKKDLRTTR
jgi:hypothetical protein